MKDDLRALEKMLDEATAPANSPPRDLTAEAESLRETWLAFGRLLEAAQGPDAPFVTQPNRSNRGWRRLRRAAAAVATLAVCILIGIGLYQFDGGAKLAAVDQEAKVIKTDKPEQPTDDDLQWDDSIDERIMVVKLGVVYARSDLAHTYNPADAIGYRLRRALYEVENSSF